MGWGLDLWPFLSFALLRNFYFRFVLAFFGSYVAGNFLAVSFFGEDLGRLGRQLLRASAILGFNLGGLYVGQLK